MSKEECSPKEDVIIESALSEPIVYTRPMGSLFTIIIKYLLPICVVIVVVTMSVFWMFYLLH